MIKKRLLLDIKGWGGGGGRYCLSKVQTGTLSIMYCIMYMDSNVGVKGRISEVN
jgi:hypothetical protein